MFETSGGAEAGVGEGANRSIVAGLSGADERIISHMPPAPRQKAPRIRSGMCSSAKSVDRFTGLPRFAIHQYNLPVYLRLRFVSHFDFDSFGAGEASRHR